MVGRVFAALNELCLFASFLSAAGTGPEIWQQSNGQIDGVIMAAGTGGTLSGITKFLKARENPITYVGLSILKVFTGKESKACKLPYRSTR